MTKAHNDAPADCMTFEEHVRYLMETKGFNQTDAAMQAWMTGPIKKPLETPPDTQ